MIMVGAAVTEWLVVLPCGYGVVLHHQSVNQGRSQSQIINK